MLLIERQSWLGANKYDEYMSVHTGLGGNESSEDVSGLELAGVGHVK